MNNNYIPILVQRGKKKELWRMDISSLSLTKLIKLKEDLLKIPYDKTIHALDAIIKREIVTITPSNSINDGSYIKKYKKNKKEAKMQREVKMKKSKCRRR